MKKYAFLFFALMVLVFISGCSMKNSADIPADTNTKTEKNTQIAKEDNAEIIFFYGKTCPHCKIVEEYFSKNKITEKIQFSQKEVYGDKNNAALMKEKAKTCGIKEEALGVPMLWTKNNVCLFGDKDIIEFFNQKLNAGGTK
jgi:glutaredoxin